MGLCCLLGSGWYGVVRLGELKPVLCGVLRARLASTPRSCRPRPSWWMTLLSGNTAMLNMGFPEFMTKTWFCDVPYSYNLYRSHKANYSY